MFGTRPPDEQERPFPTGRKYEFLKRKPTGLRAARCTVGRSAAWVWTKELIEYPLLERTKIIDRKRKKERFE
jgi:hypothetical protein